jgi:hypothetical protein
MNLAMPLTLPLDVMSDRQWGVERSTVHSRQPFVLVISVASVAEAMAVEHHMTRLYGPPIQSGV